jgi:3,4-dihydroxy 2-butanone 4-phosphate synthase/GTP cyclohydrolase II
MAAEFITPESINFMARHGRGLICLTFTEVRCRQLNLPPMVSNNRSQMGTAFTVSIEAASGVTTGISAADRSHTIRVASRPYAKPTDIVQPGHIFPIVAQPGGVLMRAGHTEACCDLARLAGLNHSAVLCEIMNEDGTMARLPDLLPFARHHGLKLGSIADLIHYRAATESLVERVGTRKVKTLVGEFEMIAYRDKPSQSAHLALVHGSPTPETETLVRVHEPVSALDLIDAELSHHSWPFAKALARIKQADSGVLVLLNCAETSAELLQEFVALTGAGTPVPSADPTKYDLRTYGVGAQILRDLNVGKMRVMARPRKIPSMTGFGLQVTGHLEN